MSLFYTISLAILSAICTMLIYEFLHFNNSAIYKTVTGTSYTLLYFYFLLIVIPVFGTLLVGIKNTTLPRILNQQLTILMHYLVIPHIFLELITTNPLAPFTATPLRTHYFLIGLSTIQLASALYYCTKKMTHLRFLNTRKRVDSNRKFDFIKDFKEILDQLSHVTTLQELTIITQNFFKPAFSIPAQHVTLQMHLHEQPEAIKGYLHATKIVIKDEVEFSQFYDENDQQTELLQLLAKWEASALLPIYDKQILIGYIIVKQNARKNLFTDLDQDEMIIFADYIANTINIMRTEKIHILILCCSFGSS